MQEWGKELGVKCNACHAEDPENVIPGGPSHPRFADDSKPMKKVARLMFTMTEEINTNFVAKLEGAGLPVTCGTCHRGRISPDPFASSHEGEALPTHAPLPRQQRSLP
jgi:cytochrome c2